MCVVSCVRFACCVRFGRCVRCVCLVRDVHCVRCCTCPLCSVCSFRPLLLCSFRQFLFIPCVPSSVSGVPVVISVSMLLVVSIVFGLFIVLVVWVCCALC